VPIPEDIPDLLAWWDASTARYTDSPPTTPAAYGSRVRTWVTRAGSAHPLSATTADDASRLLGIGGAIDGASGPGLYADSDATTRTLTTTLSITRPYTIVAVWSKGQDAHVYHPLFATKSDHTSQFVGAFGGAYLGGYVDSTDPYPDDGHGPRHVSILRCNSGGSSLWVDGADATMDGTPTQDFGTLLLNDHQGALTLCQCVVYGRVLSDLETTSLTGYFATPTLNLIPDGNSLSIGDGVGAAGAWPVLLAGALAVSDPHILVANVAVSGQTTVQRDTAAATDVDAKYDATATTNATVFWEVTNDVVGGATSAQAYAHVATYGGNRKAAHAGMKLIIGGAIPRTGDAGLNAGLAAANALLKADFTGATSSPYVFSKAGGTTYGDLYIDFAAVPQLSDPTNATYFNGDQAHLTLAGYQVVADVVQAALGILTAPATSAIALAATSGAGTLTSSWAALAPQAAAWSFAATGSASLASLWAAVSPASSLALAATTGGASGSFGFLAASGGFPPAHPVPFDGRGTLS